MILRKPYAILIKNFKLIHAIVAVMMGYLTYRTSKIVTFISDYIGSSQLKISSDKVEGLFGSILFVLIAFVIILSIVIMVVLRVKKKPVKFYLYNIVIQLYTMVMYIIAFNLIKELQHGLVDIKTLKLIQDFTMAAFFAQIIALVIVIVRATGFDIKGFNFKEDLAELEIKEEDSEEFEVNFDIDTDKLKRNLKKRIRYAKYVYFENKFIINIALVIIVLISGYAYLSSLNVYSKTYSENDAFKTNEFMMEIGEAYQTKYDYRGKKLFDDANLIVVRIKVRKLYGKKGKLNTGRFILRTGDTNYYHTTEYKDELKDFGNTYVNTKIGLTEYENYLLVFKVNDIDLTRKMQLSYTDTTYVKAKSDVVKISIEPYNLNEVRNIGEASLGQELSFKDSILKDSVLKIDQFEIGDSFKLGYKYCIDDNCYDAVEYVNISASDNYNKTLLKLVGTITLDYNLPMTRYTNLFRFMDQFVTIKYKTNDQTKKVITKLKEVYPNKAKPKNTYFIETSSALANADSIILEINVRNKVYNYTLK